MVMDNRHSGRDRNENTNNIFIKNFKNGDTVTYSLILLKGNILAFDHKNNIQSQVNITTVQNGIRNDTTWDVHKSEFKAIIELKRGHNKIIVDFENTTQELNLDYEPRKTNLRVMPVYIICQGHDGVFQSPPQYDNGIDSACKRISLGSKLIQCLVAEKLYESGFGRKTFQLEHEIDENRPVCSVFRSSLNVNKARKLNEHDLWTYFGRELMLSEFASTDRKYLAFISCTRFKGTDENRAYSHDEIVAMTEAHSALGGGGLALFGTACLYTWPTTVAEIMPKFLDLTPVNSKRFMDDSCYRGTIGGCFATTLGSVCHELGHTFDLGHTKDGIMGRGFDNIDKVFTVGKNKSFSKDCMNNYNSKPVQHSTVSFQRNINITINVGEPLRVLGPRSKSTLASFSSSDLNKRIPNFTPITRPPSACSNRSNSIMIDSNKTLNLPCNDLTYFTKNCAAFLSYHRWFNNEFGRERETFTRYLKFDKNKMMIISTAGIRVVEVRDENSGLVLESYEFINQPEKRFLVPFTASSKNLEIVVEDDLGNVLKQMFSY